MYFDAGDYIKTENGRVLVRTTSLEDYPRQGYAYSAGGATPEEAKAFARAILDAADEAENPGPEFWPPQSGDLWDTGEYQYFVQGDHIYSYVNGDKQPVPKDVKRHHRGWKLLYRRGMRIGKNVLDN